MATHAVGHVVPSRYLIPVQEEHWFAAAPVHSRQFPWQLSQVLVAVLANLFEGQVSRH